VLEVSDVIPRAAILVAALAAFGAAAPTPQAGQIEANGIKIAYESFGGADGETILLIGGTGQQLVDWPKELIDELVRRGFRVLVFDNRDVGLSTRFTAAGLPDAAAIAKALQEGKPAPLPYSLRDMAKDAVGLLDALGIRQAHVAGISMGGGIAQLAAIEHPQRVLSLTSMMADSGNPALPVVARPEAFAQLPPVPATGDREAFIAYRVRTDQVLASPRYPTSEKDIRRRVERAAARSYDPAGMLRQQTVAFLGHYDPVRLAGLKGINVPTVVLQGTEDPIVPVESARDIAANIPGADLRLIEGLAHDVPVELVPVFADAIVAAATRAAARR
jgi:pimeloyl-ACP methyl ester carboxylesterase